MALSTETTVRWRLPDLPTVTLSAGQAADRATMLAADRIATDRIGLSLLLMMENAGHSLADLTRLTLGGSVSGRSIVVLAGTGNNAGGGMVAARRLAGWGAWVRIAFAQPIRRLRPAPRAQLEPLLAARVQAAVVGHDLSQGEVMSEVRRADAVIDALIGYSLAGAPDSTYRPLIELAAAGSGAVISLDLPTGVDASTGERPGAAVAADATLALGLPKRGMMIGEGARLSGAGYLADIGLPSSIFAELRIDVDGLFAAGPLLRLG
ncbi:MAG: NAD(P)H-hydrate epimerase [Chloroflexota bacterium]|nr:NAD(P)H-hydrate epimerase [Chloroflexota bacterium]